MKLRTALGALAISTLAIANANAAVGVVSLVGDKDGLGIGVTNGEGFDFNLILAEPPDVQFTDFWWTGDLDIVHDYKLPTSFTSASLELFSGGQGLGGPSSVYLNGVFVGDLTLGEGVGPLYNYAWKDTFDLTPHLALLTGHDTVEIHTADPLDSWALDYSQITISAVPEPSTYALMALGAAGIGLALRRRIAG
jgi:hypothetical protein